MWVDANAYVADRSSALLDASSAAHPAVALGETVVLGVPVPPVTRQGQRRGSPFGLRVSQRRPSNGQRSSVDQRGAVGRRSSRVQDAKDFLMHRTHAVAPSPVTVTEVTAVEALGAPPPWSQMLAEGNSAKALLDAIQELQQEPAALREHSGRLAELLHHEAWFVRRAAVGAVSRLELAPPQALELLLPSLDDEHAELRARGLTALAHLGPRARAAGERQVEARAAAAAARRLCDASAAVRAAAAACLGSLEPTQLEGELARAMAPLLSDASGAVRAEVAAALGGLGAAARRAYLAPIEALARSDALGEVRAAARRALEGNGAEAGTEAEAAGERERDCATTLLPPSCPATGTPLPPSCPTLLPLTSCSLSRVHVVVAGDGQVAGDGARDGGDTERAPLRAQAQPPPGEQGQRERAGVLVTSFSSNGSSVGCSVEPSK